MNIIKDIEAEQISEIIKKRDVPDFKSEMLLGLMFLLLKVIKRGFRHLKAYV